MDNENLCSAPSSPIVVNGGIHFHKDATINLISSNDENVQSPTGQTKFLTVPESQPHIQTTQTEVPTPKAQKPSGRLSEFVSNSLPLVSALLGVAFETAVDIAVDLSIDLSINLTLGVVLTGLTGVPLPWGLLIGSIF